MRETREPETVQTDDRATLAGYLLLLYAVGPTFGLLGLLLPHAPDANEAGILAVLGASYVAAVVIFLFRTRLPQWGYDLAAAYGTLLISASIYFSGSTHTPGAVFYLWVILGAAYFFDRRRVAVQLGLVAIGYAVALTLKGWEPGMISTWILSIGTLAIAAGLLVHTRERVAALVASLNEAAETDALTELLNRRGFDKRLEIELERARRYGDEISLVTGDLDNFKQVNDKHGHLVGDDALAAISTRLHQTVRKSDVAGRFGGDEFVVVAFPVTQEEAQSLGERIQAALSEPMVLDGAALRVGVSIGIAMVTGAVEASEVLRRADAAMYAVRSHQRRPSFVVDTA
jgi:diguanylate cyclase (GGDEF)-like protein